jgi:hypothetical protein
LRGTSAYNLVCALIARRVSSASLVHYPGKSNFPTSDRSYRMDGHRRKMAYTHSCSS